MQLRAFTDKYLDRFDCDSKQELIDHLNVSWPEYNRYFAHPFTWSWTRNHMYQWAEKKVYQFVQKFTLQSTRARPENERVSRCWRALTFPHLPSCVAFTIRTWSRRTFRWTSRQLTAGRFIVASEDTPTESSVVICFSPLIGLPDSLVRKDQREVCPLSRGAM
jgi:hypothetical protein